jgi:hypothetical protein
MVDIEQIDHDRVVLAVPVLRLLVLGRSVDNFDLSAGPNSGQRCSTSIR